MDNLRIATWDIGNSHFRLKENEYKATAVVGLLELYDLDFLALQEVNSVLLEKICEKLEQSESNYYIAPSKSFVKNICINHNIIISKLRPIGSDSENLPFLSKSFKLTNIFPNNRCRIYNHIYYDRKNDSSLFLFNTKLDEGKELGKRQMNRVQELVKSTRNYDFNCILLGNFNSKPIDKNMIEFTEKLSCAKMKVVENDNSTSIKHWDNQPIDYVVVPDSWEVESVETINTEPMISLHSPVMVNVKRR